MSLPVNHNTYIPAQRFCDAPCPTTYKKSVPDLHIDLCVARFKHSSSLFANHYIEASASQYECAAGIAGRYFNISTEWFGLIRYAGCLTVYNVNIIVLPPPPPLFYTNKVIDISIA